MNNSFFVRSTHEGLKIERFHMCSWEFENSKSILEFGLEIDSNSLNRTTELTLDIFIPWLDSGCQVEDFYDKLKGSDNSRFIFNDSVLNTISLDGGQNNQGVIHEFQERNKLCILPVKLEVDFPKHRVRIKLTQLDFSAKNLSGTNVYIRFAVKPNAYSISTKKNSIGKSTIIYDIKVNEERNVPSELINTFRSSYQCNIISCFCLHILPNNYNITFLESEHLKSVRTLEFKPFKNYLNDKRVKKDELIVVFSKKKGSSSYSFFSIYTLERIGAAQFTTAIFVNILCAFLFAFPAIRKEIPTGQKLSGVLSSISWEYYAAFVLLIILSFYFFILQFPKSRKKIYGYLPTTTT